MQLSNYLTKNYSRRKVEIEGESTSTPIDSAVTGERPHMDRDVLLQPVQKQEVTRVPILFILDILCVYCVLGQLFCLKPKWFLIG